MEAFGIAFNSDLPEEVFKADPKMLPQDPYDGLPPMDNSPGEVNLAFLISLSVTFTVMMIVLVIAGIYIMLTSDEEAEFDEESNNSGRRGRPIHSILGKRKAGLLLDSSFITPGEFDDSENLRETEEREFLKMSSFEIDLYKRAKEYYKMAPPILEKIGKYLNKSDLRFIKDRGIQSYFLLPSINDNVDANGSFLPSFLIEDKLNIKFTKYNKSASSIMNYPLPSNKRDAVYFEVKVFKLPRDSNTIFSIGLITAPYPYFRMPGMSNYSIAYESTGKLRINNPFTASTLLPKLQEGDVVGFGYRYKYGSVFITHNGKKLMDAIEGIDTTLFIGIGGMNASYTRTYTKDGLLEDLDNLELREQLSKGETIHLPEKLDRLHDIKKNDDQVDSDEVELQVNLGQIGFVFIEANVKKYGFGKIFGNIGIPPSYNGEEIKRDIILQKSEELPPNYFTFETELEVGTSNAGGEIINTNTNIHNEITNDDIDENIIGSNLINQEINSNIEEVENIGSSRELLNEMEQENIDETLNNNNNNNNENIETPTITTKKNGSNTKKKNNKKGKKNKKNKRKTR